MSVKFFFPVVGLAQSYKRGDGLPVTTNLSRALQALFYGISVLHIPTAKPCQTVQNRF